MFDPCILAAFGGGIVGAAIGGLNSFVLVGLVVLSGVAASFLGMPEASAILQAVAFGPFLAPNVAFVGGVAAATYAQRKGLDITGKDIAVPLTKFGDTSVLLVGGVFGIIGYLLNNLWITLNLKTDTPGLTVVLTAILARAVFFGEGPFGTVPVEMKGMGFGAHFKVVEGHCWLPWQKNLGMLILLGLGFGLPAAYLGIATGQPVLAFGIGAAYIIFLTMGTGFPVIHHILLPAAMAGQTTGNILIGAVFGILGALLGEAAARLFYNYGKNHIDPPAIAIVILTTAILTLL